jgi:hypothetical protein
MKNYKQNSQNYFDYPTHKGDRTITRVHPRFGRAFSHIALCRLIGGLGISLPFVLEIGNSISADTLPPGSLSGYYYTDMRSFFIGGLCALGVFLLAYRGYERLDGLITDIAGTSMILVALCPTRPPEGNLHLTVQQNVVGDLHDFFAIIVPLSLGAITLRFARAQRQPEVLIHLACATIIFSCVPLAIVSSFMFRSTNINPRPLLVCEVLAMLASGISWLTPRRVYRSPALKHTMTLALCAPSVDTHGHARHDAPTHC